MTSSVQLLGKSMFNALPRQYNAAVFATTGRFYSTRVKNRSSIKEYNEIVKAGPVGTDKPDQKYFRITLMRSAIVAGKIFAVKELVDVAEVDQALTKAELKELRRPDRGYYIESRAREAHDCEQIQVEQTQGKRTDALNIRNRRHDNGQTEHAHIVVSKLRAASEGQHASMCCEFKVLRYSIGRCCLMIAVRARLLDVTHIHIKTLDTTTSDGHLDKRYSYGSKR
ncbi:hypothetical protein MRB53_039503 [Persea americana]|nr:hypothetical protein MRB53_039503 [Persea americana]